MIDKKRLCVKSVSDADEARLLYDPMRREILRLLAKGSQTQTQLSKLLGLRTPSVGHHLSALKANGLIFVAREEPGEHGIIEKFYEANAQLFFIDRRRMPLDIRRYFMPIDIERARGILACVAAKRDAFYPSSSTMEQFAASLADSISQVALDYEVPVSDADPELLICSIYCEALKRTLNRGYRNLGSILYDNE